MSRNVGWPTRAVHFEPLTSSELESVACAHSAKGLTPGNSAGRAACRKPVSKGPSQTGAVMINSEVTVVSPCWRPVTMHPRGLSAAAAAKRAAVR